MTRVFHLTGSIGGAALGAALLAAFLMTPSARGQSHPSGGGHFGGPPGYAGRFDDLGAQSAGDFPIGPLGAAVDATARAVQARFMFDRAEDNLKYLVQDQRNSFESSREYREAVDAEQRAFDELKGARAAAINRMAEDPDRGTEYRELISLRNEFTQRIAERRQVRGIPIGDIVSLAAVKLGYATSATAMEVTAEAADPRITDARLKLMDAGSHLAELEKGFAQHVREDPDMVAARAKIEDARLNRLIALTVQEGAVDVANDAMDYLYYTHHRFDSFYGSASYYANLGNPSVFVGR